MIENQETAKLDVLLKRVRNAETRLDWTIAFQEFARAVDKYTSTFGHNEEVLRLFAYEERHPTPVKGDEVKLHPSSQLYKRTKIRFWTISARVQDIHDFSYFLMAGELRETVVATEADFELR